MSSTSKLAAGFIGGAAVVGGAAWLINRIRNSETADVGMGAYEYEYRAACTPLGQQCNPEALGSGCCQEVGKLLRVCRKQTKGADQNYYCLPEVLSTQASTLGEGTAGPGAQAGGDIKVNVASPRYLITWYDQDGNGAVSDLSILEGEALIDAVVAMGGGEADIPRCTKYPNFQLALIPMDMDMYPSEAAHADMLDAINHGYADYLRDHAFMYKEIEVGPAPKSVMFKNVWPGGYWLYNLKFLNNQITQVKIGVENFDLGLGNVIGNMYSMLSSYLGGDMDWSQITVSRSCKLHPSYRYVTPNKAGVRMGGAAVYNFQPYYHFSFHEGDLSDTMEWLQDAFNDMGEYISDVIDAEFG